MIGILRTGQRGEFGDPDVHFLRGLGIRRVEELEFQTGYLTLRSGLRDAVGRRNIRDLGAFGAEHTDSARDCPFRAEVEQSTEGIERPPGHGIAGHNVFPDRELVERCDRARCDDRHLSRRNVLDVDDSLDSAVVVDMGVRVDDCRDRLVADMLTNHLHALPCRFDSGHTVDDDQSLVTLYDRQVRDVVVPHLIEAIRHLVKPTSAYDLTLAP